MHKITIVSRGQALGLTISLPTEDKYLMSRSALMDDLAMTLGGRAAEELVFHEITTGAANDLEKVTHTAKQMIMRYGMSEKLGPRVLGRNTDMPFLGREMGHEPDYSDEVAREIDEEIRRVIEEAHDSRDARAPGAHGGAAPDLGDPDRARDDRQGSVRAARTPARPRQTVFPDEEPVPEPAQPEEERKRLPQPKPRPFPQPGRALQPPPPPEPTGYPRRREMLRISRRKTGQARFARVPIRS